MLPNLQTLEVHPLFLKIWTFAPKLAADSSWPGNIRGITLHTQTHEGNQLARINKVLQKEDFINTIFELVEFLGLTMDNMVFLEPRDFQKQLRCCFEAPQKRYPHIYILSEKPSDAVPR